jgi:threonine dehydratase
MILVKKGMNLSMTTQSLLMKMEDIMDANQMIKNVIVQTPLQRNEYLSNLYDCNVYLKREDLQVVRSFKIRGAFYMIQSLTPEERKRGVVCASAGNHAQGVAYSCSKLRITGKIFMPTTTPRQKVEQVKRYGGSFVEVILTGDTFDDSYLEAKQYGDEHHMSFVHPFDDPRTIAGQGTIGMEIMNDMDKVDYLFASVGGGGLIAGVSTYMKGMNPDCKIIGAEPEGAPSMKRSLEAGHVVELDKIDPFVDGAAVKKVGQLTYQMVKEQVEDIVLVPEGKACSTILELYNQIALVVEPAGALPVAALDFYRQDIKGKNIVCIISGGNNDIDRMQEMKEKSLIYEGLKHYFIVSFPQRAGALRQFLENVLGKDDDITRFEYTKKNNKSSGPALVGIELKDPSNYQALLNRMEQYGFSYIEVNNDPTLFNLLI